MSPNAKKLYDMVELLPDREQELIYELVVRLLPDDMATADDLAAISEAQEEYKRGETVNLRDFIAADPGLQKELSALE